MTYGAFKRKRSSAVTSLVLAIFAAIFLTGPVVFADNPANTSTTASSSIQSLQNATIAFQGNLNDASGTAVADGLYNLNFKIYDASSSGNVQWQQSFVGGQRVQVTDGAFSVSLGGGVTPINLDFGATDYYLAVTIGGTEDPPVWDTEMTPRKEIITVEQLLEKANADGKSLLDEFMSTLDSGNNMVVIVDSATMASLLASLEKQSSTTSSAALAGANGGGVLGELAGFFVNAFESIEASLAGIANSMSQSLNLLADISVKVDQIYQAVVVDKGLSTIAPTSTPASISPPVTISPPSPNDSTTSQQSGSAILPANDDSVSIVTPAIQDASNVLITLTGSTGEETIPQSDWTITNRVDGQYFTITFNQSTSTDRRIDWWVLNTESSSGSATTSSTVAPSTTTSTESDVSSSSVPSSIEPTSTASTTTQPSSTDASSTDSSTTFSNESSSSSAPTTSY